MIKVAVIGIVTILLAILLKSHKNEYAFYVSAAGCVLMLFLAADRLSGIIGIVNRIYSEISIDSMYIEILLKMLGIAFVAEFTSGICKDAGFASVGMFVELVGKLSILLTSAPILEALLDVIGNSFGL